MIKVPIVKIEDKLLTNKNSRLNYANANGKIGEIWMNMVNTTYNPTVDTINKVQLLKGKTKLKFFKK